MRRLPPRDAITDETMMPLSVAAEVAVAHGVITTATTKALKREADLGRLTVYEVFGRLHTTLGDIKTMIRASAVQPRVPAADAGRTTSAQASSTEPASALASVQFALERRLEELKTGRPKAPAASRGRRKKGIPG